MARGSGPLDVILTGISLGWTLARVIVFTVFALSLFVLAFLGYFIVPFVFLGVALVLFTLGLRIHPASGKYERRQR